jgi:hypothetical protein
MKLKVFLFLMLFFSSFSAFAMSKADAIAACTAAKALVGNPVGTGYSCSVKISQVDLIFDKSGGINSTWGFTPLKCVLPQFLSADGLQCLDPDPVCNTYNEYLDTTVTPHVCKPKPPIQCPAPQINDPNDSQKCIKQCTSLDIYIVGVQFCPDDPNCQYSYSFLGVKHCSATPPPTCTLPQVFDAATNTCKMPPPPTCTLPQVLDTATNTCKTPPPTCTSPQVLNPATNLCETKATCQLPFVLDAATNLSSI